MMTIDTKPKAFVTHLLISIAVLAVLLAIIFFRWYPGELIHAGATDGLRILIGVDLVLGPLLTLIVFDRTKKSLTSDLVVIGVIQITCLLGGLWLVYNERPIAQVLADDGIHLITKSDISTLDNNPRLKTTGVHPNAYLLELPSDWSKIPSIKMTSELADENPFSFRFDLYTPFSDIKVQDFDDRLLSIIQHLPENTKESLKSLASHESCTWVPVISRHTKGSACVTYERGVVRLSEHKKLLSLSR